MRRFDIKWKFMAVIIILAGFIIVLGLVLYDSMFAIIEQQASDNTAQLITKIGNDIDSLVLGIDNSILPLLYDRDVRALYEGDAKAQDSVDADIAQVISGYDDDGITLLMINRSTKVIASSRQDLIAQYRILGMQWINKIHTANRQPVLISGHTVNQSSTGRVENVVCLAHSIRNESGEALGYLMVEIPISLLGSICEDITLGKEGFIAVLDSDNYVIYSTKPRLTGSQQQLAPIGEECERDYYYRTLDGKPNLVTDYQSSDNSLLVMGFVPFANINKEAGLLRSQLILAVSLISILILLYAYSVSISITKPLVRLKDHMQQVEHGDFSVRIHSRRKDEIGSLERGFDSMNEQLCAMRDMVTRSQLQEKEARFQTLVATINPHFLYNTLESISMTAYINNDLETVEIMRHFADLMRYSAILEAQDISVAEEILHVQDYVFLKQIRQPGLFDVCWDVDEELREYRMLRHLMQPLVENSILHGFADMNEGGIIEICLFALGKHLICRVRDNGTGIPEERYSELLSALNNRVTSDDALALTNIHERIQLAYGDEFGIEIQSHCSGSCVIELHLPLLQPCSAGGDV